MAKFRRDERFLDIDASMQGTLSFRNPVNLRINGSFEGRLNFRGTLTIGETASVNADIFGEKVFIEGMFKGRIESQVLVSLKNTSHVEADIITPALEIESGAFFEGSVKMVKESLTLEELSTFLNVERDRIEAWVKEGRIPYFQKEGMVLFERKKIEEWLLKEKVST